MHIALISDNFPPLIHRIETYYCHNIDNRIHAKALLKTRGAEDRNDDFVGYVFLSSFRSTVTVREILLCS